MRIPSFDPMPPSPNTFPNFPVPKLVFAIFCLRNTCSREVPFPTALRIFHFLTSCGISCNLVKEPPRLQSYPLFVFACRLVLLVPPLENKLPSLPPRFLPPSLPSPPFPPYPPLPPPLSFMHRSANPARADQQMPDLFSIGSPLLMFVIQTLTRFAPE